MGAILGLSGCSTFLFSFSHHGFKPISAEQRGVIIYLYDEGKSQRFIAKKTGTSRKGVQGVLKRWIETGDAKCQP